ncbi:MAG: phosphotriesterase [Solirubrobacterales bacterium]|jgi:phosphotriesterase-related protein|nr:phosphotriesterase [Solirubrobacterales bacterium]
MPLIQTTAGPVEAAELGRTLVHEHLNTAAEGVRFQWPHLVDHDEETARAVAQVRSVQAHGVETICDPGVLDLGRDVQLHLRVQEQTGMRFVLATGVYGQHYTFLPHYFQTRPPEALVDCFRHDLEVGLQGSGVKAHFLKCAADTPGFTEDVEKVHRAVAQASLATGAPIMAHSNPKERTGLRSVEILLEEGVAPGKVQVAHTGDTADWDHVHELLQTGVSVGIDRYGLDDFYGPGQAVRNDMVKRAIDAGFADRLMLGQDHCASIDWFPREVVAQLAPKWSFHLVFDEVVPELLELGVTQDQVDAMLGANVHAWLAA